MPPLQIATKGEGQWGARASSVAEVERALAQMWAAAAHSASTSGLSDAADAEAMGDPRVAPFLVHGADVRVRTRTRVLTLIVSASRPETEERAIATVAQLAGRHPSRAIIVAPGDPEGPPSIDARLSLTCIVRPDSMTETCAERILLRVGGEATHHLSGVVAPLLIHDLPVVLWWPDDAPFGSVQLRELLDTSDELLVDSGSFRDDGAIRLTQMAATIAAGEAAIRDVGWMRLTLWRELLAALFDHPLLRPELQAVRSVRVDVLRPAATLRVSKAALFASWLAASLGWEVSRPLGPQRGTDSLHASWRSGRGEVKLELRPVSTHAPVGARGAGSLQRVELELARGGHLIRARVTRHSDHLLATAEWDGAEITRRAGRLEPFEEAPYLADALDRLGRDRVFEAAALQAARLIGSRGEDEDG
jgi:glucose-6-phosphate dehydrogenase assembly protein OpcA